MRLNTKQKRLDLLKYEFNHLAEKGFIHEVYKDLNIFVKDGDKPTMKAFSGTSTKPIVYSYYRSIERLNEMKEQLKKSADLREQRKTDAKGKRKLSSHAAAAKAIREELKTHFPNVKFSVKSDSFSMGNSISISWEDGPTTKEVNHYADKYQYGHFNGMEDIYESSNRRDDIPQAKYVSTSRDMSNETKTILLPQVEVIFKTHPFNSYNAENLLYRLFVQTSFPTNAEIKGIEPTDKTAGSCVSEFYKVVFKTDETETPEDDFLDFVAEMLEDEPVQVNAYEERQAAKAERFRELAEKARAGSSSAYKAAKQIGDFIPMGQPILVGHHSEGRHRRDLSRIDNNMRKSIELDEKAKYYEGKANNAENSNVISSDDPEAIRKLKEKLAGLVKNQELMKAANKVIRNKKLSEIEKVEQIEKYGLSTQQAIEILRPNFLGDVGFASYSLTNNNANMATVRKRIEYLEGLEAQESKTFLINGTKVVDDTDANRLRIYFDDIPEPETRTQLKRNGFRWSPYNKCWQSYRGQYQIDRAKTILTN